MSAKGCNLCGENVDVHDGGAVLMFTFCRWNSVTLTNVSFCSECYRRLMDKDLRRLNANCDLRIDFGMPRAEAEQAMEELLAAVPKWISVEDALPTDEDGDPWDRCIVYTDEDTIQTLPLCKVGNGYVTHWLPLPEPPKEVE